MARSYDAVYGRRFDKNHEVWRTKMLTKAGKPYARMDYKKAAELEEQGLIRLVPAVTDIASVANGFGLFGNAARWGMEIGVDAAIETSQSADDSVWRTDAVERAKEIMDAPKEKGSELHEVYHLIETGAMRYEQATDDQKAFYDACVALLESLDIRVMGTETVFVTSEYGGTADLSGGRAMLTVGIDWKTVQKARPPRKSEILQVSAYAQALGWSEALICYYDQGEKRFHDPLFLDGDMLDRAFKTFRTALELYNQLDKLGKRTGIWQD